MNVFWGVLEPRAFEELVTRLGPANPAGHDCGYVREARPDVWPGIPLQWDGYSRGVAPELLWFIPALHSFFLWVFLAEHLQR